MRYEYVRERAFWDHLNFETAKELNEDEQGEILLLIRKCVLSGDFEEIENHPLIEVFCQDWGGFAGEVIEDQIVPEED